MLNGFVVWRQTLHFSRRVAMLKTLFSLAGKETMKEMTDKLFKHNVDESEKEFTYTEFLQLVDDNNGILGQKTRNAKGQ